MPELRFLTEATFIIGCGVGFLSGTLVSWTLHAWTLAGMETDRPFEGGRLKAFEKEKRWIRSTGNTYEGGRLIADSSGGGTAPHSYQDHPRRMRQASRPDLSKRKKDTVNLNRRQKISLCALILNETTRNANDLPLEDVPLTHETLERYGFGSKVRRRVRDEIVEKRLGWKDDAGIVYLNRHKAREFVARARRAGVIGGR